MGPDMSNVGISGSRDRAAFEIRSSLASEFT